MRIDTFNFIAETNTLSAEASDLGLNSTPTKIDVVGRTATHSFFLAWTRYDNEGDITHWEYTSPTTPIRLVIFND